MDSTSHQMKEFGSCDQPCGVDADLVVALWMQPQGVADKVLAVSARTLVSIIDMAFSMHLGCGLKSDCVLVVCNSGPVFDASLFAICKWL
jgi:hypothetical protein